MIKKKYQVIILALYLSLLLGLFLEEDFLGGAAIDYSKILTNKLSIFKEDLLYYLRITKNSISDIHQFFKLYIYFF